MDSNFICTTCSGSLLQDGLLLDSVLGPLVMCMTCRALYYLQTSVQPEGVLITLIRAVIEEDEAYSIIRQSNSHENFGAFLKKQIERHTEHSESSFDRPKNVIDKELLQDVIRSSTTPTDFILKLKSL